MALGYYRMPAMSGEALAFVSEDDVWPTSLGAGPAPPILGKKTHRDDPRKEDYLWSRKGWMAGHLSMVRRVDVWRSAFDSDIPRSRRIPVSERKTEVLHGVV